MWIRAARPVGETVPDYSDETDAQSNLDWFWFETGQKALLGASGGIDAERRTKNKKNKGGSKNRESTALWM